MPLDYALYKYRQRMGLSWPEVVRTPRWRIRQDFFYMGLEGEGAYYQARKG